MRVVFGYSQHSVDELPGMTCDHPRGREVAEQTHDLCANMRILIAGCARMLGAKRCSTKRCRYAC